MAYKIMIQGTASDVGKSIIATALCRHFYRQGLKVAPFKAQNMALNSYVTPDGGEIGRSQAVQARAAGTVPRVEMNPVLLKPKGEMRSQVMLMGQPYLDMSAADYRREFLPTAKKYITDALAVLEREYDLIVMEGAGSPVELNLKAGDIVNMAAAEAAKSPVILVADIDRGGVFASLVGTFALLSPGEQQRVRGVIVNKFRGDPALFTAGIDIIQAKLERPVLGVLPYIQRLDLPAEDSLALSNLERAPEVGKPMVHVVSLPTISNFTDFEPLTWAGAGIRLVTKPSQLEEARAIILPGTKNTIQDLHWLQETGLATAIKEAAQRGAWVLGICGGYQMLGHELSDDGSEDSAGTWPGLNLLPVQTTYRPGKVLRQVKGNLLPGELAGTEVEGYEIHQGITSRTAGEPFARLENGALDGAVSPDLKIMGTYLHGVLESPGFLQWWLSKVAGDMELAPVQVDFSARDQFEQAADRLADHFAANVDTEEIWRIITSWKE